jgi:phosphoserine phosphatase
MKVFDFDNTLYDGESLVDFFEFLCDKKDELRKYKKLVKIMLKLYEMNMLPTSLIKKELNKHKNDVSFNTNNIDKYVNEFWDKNKHKLNKDLIKLINKDDLIITASLDVLLNPIRKELKTKHIISSIANIEKKDIDFICYKENKVLKYKELYKDQLIDVLYTDSYADKPLMDISKKVILIDKKTKEMKVIKGE